RARQSSRRRRGAGSDPRAHRGRARGVGGRAMKAPGVSGGQRAFEALELKVDALRREIETTQGEISKDRARNLLAEAGIPPSARSWADVTPESREQYERSFRERGERVRRLEASIEQSRRLLAPLEALMVSWKALTPVDCASSQVDLAIRN